MVEELPAQELGAAGVGRRLYATESSSGLVLEIDTGTFRMLRILAVGAQPSRLVVGPDDRSGWVLSGARPTIGVVRIP